MHFQQDLEPGSSEPSPCSQSPTSHVLSLSSSSSSVAYSFTKSLELVQQLCRFESVNLLPPSSKLSPGLESSISSLSKLFFSASEASIAVTPPHPTLHTTPHHTTPPSTPHIPSPTLHPSTGLELSISCLKENCTVPMPCGSFPR